MSVKRVARVESLDLGAANLFLEDLEECLAILREFAGERGTTTVEVPGYEAEGIAELAAAAGAAKVERIEITARSDGRWLALQFRDVRSLAICSDAEHLPTRGAVERVRAFLDSRCRTLRYHVRRHRWLIFVLGSLVLMLSSLALSQVLHGNAGGWITLPVALAFGALLGGGGGCRISFARRSEQQTFWSTNRDKIVLIVITAIVSALVGWISRSLTGKP